MTNIGKKKRKYIFTSGLLSPFPHSCLSFRETRGLSLSSRPVSLTLTLSQSWRSTMGALVSNWSAGGVWARCCVSVQAPTLCRRHRRRSSSFRATVSSPHKKEPRSFPTWQTGDQDAFTHSHPYSVLLPLREVSQLNV